MAIQTAGSSPAHTAQVVASAFVEKYYRVFLTEPEVVHKFYEDSSMLSRPGPNGEMTTATTMEGIKDKILSLNYKGYTAEITTVDAQDSCKEGVIVLVTGCLTGRDNVKSSFTQTFFLARHATGYYVMNDVFRFMDVLEAVTSSAVNDANDNVASAPLTPNQESAHVPSHLDQNDGSSPKKVTSNGGEVCESADKKGSVDGKVSVVKEVVSSEQPLISSQKDGPAVAESASNNQEDPQKMSYASIVAKETTVTSSPVQLSTVIVGPSSTHQQQCSAAPKASALRSNSAPQNRSTTHTDGAAPQNRSTSHTEGKGIFIGNLPSDVSAEQLNAIFKKFGPIKKDGIHMITCKEDGFCYGFVEFESSSSARNAIEAHFIMVGSKEAYITEKRSTNQASNGRGRFPSGKGEFRNNNRNDNYRNRENFVDGRNHGRYQHGNRGEASGQTRGPAGRNGEAHQRVYQNGGGRTGAQ